MTTTTRLRAAGVLSALVLASTALTACTSQSTPQARTSAAHPQPSSRKAAAGVVVVIGASVSGGYNASPGAAWPTELANRLHHSDPSYQLVNASISATRLLTDSGPTMPSSLTREDKDALAVPGVRTVILTDLINDIQQPPHQYDPAVIIAGLKSFITRAHAKQVRVVGTTIPPYGGFERYEPAGERCRQAVNTAIRAGRLFDAFIDFDATLKDPTTPTRLRPTYDSGDHLHPNTPGHQAISQSINPTLLTQ
ncbi:hypothetical protein GCM10010522_49860 [Kribbella solani]|nr:GDSL-type esterase/lipase family protein [Kribbella solani]